jgi:propanol-preferring alcohol dehydrogenase
MILERLRTRLRLVTLPDPVPATHQVLVRAAACGVCRTDLHIVDGELDHAKPPIIGPRNRWSDPSCG